MEFPKCQEVFQESVNYFNENRIICNKTDIAIYAMKLFGEKLLDYAAQEAELETVYENPVNPSMGSFEIVNKESITNIKHQIK